jgi:hypothetical protein
MEGSIALPVPSPPWRDCSWAQQYPPREVIKILSHEISASIGMNGLGKSGEC